MEERTYLVTAHVEELEQLTYDVVVVGSGIAGMSVALSLDSRLRVASLSKKEISHSSTYKAQGGVAVAVGSDDNPELHTEDTLRVGQGLCRKDAVEVMTSEGPAALNFLITLGAQFNYDQTGLDLTREGGHGRHRVVHRYDYTGRHIAEVMEKQTRHRDNIDHFENAFLLDVLTHEGTCCGCIVQYQNKLVVLKARAIVIATGGYSGLFERSTNAASCRGDGIAAAYRAGARIADMEFVQFHPTAFTTLSGRVFLLTEALRGEGAILRNDAGEQFMKNYHSDAELAPRDEVSRAIVDQQRRGQKTFVYLDATHMGGDYLADRFRQVYSELAKNGYYMERDWIPIAPAAHYTIGGIATDLWGRSNIDGLLACGEASATGVHGANRLASNSLLEGLVFGRRIAQLLNDKLPPQSSCNPERFVGCFTNNCPDVDQLRAELDGVAGVVRHEGEMVTLLNACKTGFPTANVCIVNSKAFSIYNAFQLVPLILRGAILRRESRGTHFRPDYPERNDAKFQKHIYHQWNKEAVLE